jgi:hypothetical protein
LKKNQSLFSYHPQQHQSQLIQQQIPLQQNHHMIPQNQQPKEMHKPKGRMSAYTFFVQKCRDEHRKAYPNENANFSEFSKKCAEKWKVKRERKQFRLIFYLYP